MFTISIALSKSVESASDPSNPLPKTELHLSFTYSMQISSIYPLPKHKSQERSLKARGSHNINNWTFSVISLFRGFCVDESAFSNGQRTFSSGSFWPFVIHLENERAKLKRLEEQKGFLRVWEHATILSYKCTWVHEMLYQTIVWTQTHSTRTSRDKLWLRQTVILRALSEHLQLHLKSRRADAV